MRTRTCVAILVLGLALAGCGTDGEQPEVASAAVATSSAPSVPSDGPGGKLEDLGVKFAQCLREHGLNVEDPEPGKGLLISIPPGSDISRETADKAMEACRRYSPQANASPGADPAREEAGRAFARCMRDNGVESFPDPEPGQVGIRITPEQGEDPDFPAAQEKCRGLLAPPAPGPGARR